MIKFRVKIAGQWEDVTRGTILQDGRRLRWWRGGLTSIAGMSEWELSPSTKADPRFKAACWAGLNAEEQALAIARRSPVDVLRLAG